MEDSALEVDLPHLLWFMKASRESFLKKNLSALHEFPSSAAFDFE
jgi:hypothetical protein